MAKKYALRNTTTKPPRPLYVVTGKAEGTPGMQSVLISTDGLPVFLTQSQYDACKEAVQTYVKHKMLRLDILEAKDKTPLPEVEVGDDLPELPNASKVDAPEKDPLKTPETKDELEKYALHHFGVNIDKRKSLATIKKEIAELEGALAGDATEGK